MNELNIKPYLVRLFLGAFIFFVLNKVFLRPLVLENDVPAWLDVFVLSVPNTIESIFGMSLVGGILMVARQRFYGSVGSVTRLAVYLVTLVLVGMYVLTQEFKLHNLGGNNVYDPNDVIASVVGMIVMFVLFVRFGITVEPGPDSQPSS